MNLNQLRFAEAVASTGSFTAAASACCVTQPTLSNGVAQLEDELGGRLFSRTTRKVALTMFGVHVMPYLVEVLRAQSTLEQQASAYLKPAKRLIRIGSSPLVKASLLSLMIEPFRTLHPDLAVVLREMNMTDLHRMLDDGLLDFVVGVAGSRKGTRKVAPLYSEPLLYVPRGGQPPPASRDGFVELNAIANEVYVMVPDACGLARTTRELFRSHRKKLLEYSGEAMSYQVLEEWATLGIGSAILPQSKIRGRDHAAFQIKDKTGQAVQIRFEASWSTKPNVVPHLVDFEHHLLQVVPRIVSGLNR